MAGVLHDNVADADIRSGIGRDREYATKSFVGNTESVSCGIVQAEE